MRWARLFIVTTFLSVASNISPADDSLHTLTFMEGRYAGYVSIEATLERAQTPRLRGVPATVVVERPPDGLILRWAIAGDSYAAAIVGAIGPTTYRPPEHFLGTDWECRPGSIPPFRREAEAIVLRLVCFTPDQLHRPPTARIEIGNTLDPASRKVANGLIFELSEMSSHQENRVVRRSRGLLVRKAD